MQELILIKLGGSLITDKTRPFILNYDMILEKINEIKYISQNIKEKIIIGHGGGSFPHFYAQVYSVQKGFIDKDSQLGFCKVQDSAAILNRIIIKCLLDINCKALSFSISNVCTQTTGNIEYAAIDGLFKMLQHDIIPVVYGDIAFDKNNGCSVISTENIFQYIFNHIEKHYSDNYRISKIILAGCTDGVYTKDPNIYKDAVHIEMINNKNYSYIEKFLSEAHGIDVTGGMFSKVKSMLKIKSDISIQIINGTKKGLLKRAVEGEHVGTIIRTV